MLRWGEGVHGSFLFTITGGGCSENTYVCQRRACLAVEARFATIRSASSVRCCFGVHRRESRAKMTAASAAATAKRKWQERMRLPRGVLQNRTQVYHLARVRTDWPVSSALKSTKPVSGVMLRKRGSISKAFSTCSMSHKKIRPNRGFWEDKWKGRIQSYGSDVQEDATGELRSCRQTSLKASSDMYHG